MGDLVCFGLKQRDVAQLRFGEFRQMQPENSLFQKGCDAVGVDRGPQPEFACEIAGLGFANDGFAECLRCTFGVEA